MSVSTAPAPAPRTAAPANGRRRKLSLPMLLLALACGLIVISAVRAITGAEDVTSSAQVTGALQMAVPIGMAGLAGLWSERAGVVNIGLEGMMILGSFFGAWAGWQHGPWLGLLAGVIGGMLGGLVHAVATVTFGVDHIVSGVAITLLAQGTTQYLAKIWFNAPAVVKLGGSPKQSPQIDPVSTVTVPGLSPWLASVEKHHWFLVSDLAGLCGGIVSHLSLFTLLAAVLLVGSYFVLWRTPFGLRLRSCGEAPVAAESLGVNVYTYKYIGVIISGGLAGFGGAFLAMVPAHAYQEGQTGGRGYIGLAAMIFGNWRPGGLAIGAGLFGYTDDLQLRNGGPAAHALLLLLFILLVGLTGWKFHQKRQRAAGVSAADARAARRLERMSNRPADGTAVVHFLADVMFYRKRYQQSVAGVLAAAGLLCWFVMTKSIPSEFVGATPYVATLLVLSLSAQRLRMPKADGKPYRKGQGK